MKKCPFCAEEIQEEAIKCKHCGEMLDDSQPLSKNEATFVFQYRAKNGNAKDISGQIEAITQDVALNKLHAQGLWVISINPLGSENRNLNISNNEESADTLLKNNIGGKSVPTEISTKQGLATILVITVFIIMSMLGTFNASPSSKKSKTLTSSYRTGTDLDLIGSEIRLVSEVAVAINEDVFKKYIRTVMAKDIEGWQMMYMSKEIYDVPSGIKVRVINLGGAWNSLAEIRILEGVHSLKVGWTGVENVRGR